MDLKKKNEELTRQYRTSEIEKEQLKQQLAKVEEIYERLQLMHGSENEFK